MRILKWLGAAAISALAVYAIYYVSWLPSQCEIAKKRTESIVMTIADLPATAPVISSARNGISDMERCIAVSPTDVGLYMAMAANQSVIGRLQDAANTYVAALRYDRRPEIFLNLGLVQLQMNQRSAAFANLTKACLFNINF